MYSSENQHTARMRGGCRHETEPFNPTDGVERSPEMYERVLGHAMMAGTIDATEADRLYSNYLAWYVVQPEAPTTLLP